MLTKSFELALISAAGYALYRIGLAIVAENSAPALPPKRRKIHRSPPPDVGVDVSART